MKEADLVAVFILLSNNKPFRKIIGKKQLGEMERSHVLIKQAIAECDRDHGGESIRVRLVNYPDHTFWICRCLNAIECTTVIANNVLAVDNHLLKHNRSKKSDVKLTFECVHCNASFDSADTMSRHIQRECQKAL